MLWLSAVETVVMTCGCMVCHVIHISLIRLVIAPPPRVTLYFELFPPSECLGVVVPCGGSRVLLCFARGVRKNQLFKLEAGQGRQGKLGKQGRQGRPGRLGKASLTGKAPIVSEITRSPPEISQTRKKINPQAICKLEIT